MQSIVIAFCIIYVIWSLLKKKKIYSPDVVFVGMWGIIIIALSFGAYNLPAISAQTYTIVFVGLLGFVFGGMLAKVKVKTREKIVVKSLSQDVNQTRFMALILLCMIVLLVPLSKALSLLATNSFHSIRYVYQDEILSNELIAVLYVYFAEPFLNFLTIYALIDFMMSKRYTYLILACVCILMNTIIGAGRFLLLYFICTIVILLFVNGKKLWRGRSKKANKSGKFLLCVGIAAIVVVSVTRGSDILRTVYVYACGGLPFMDELLEAYAFEPTYGTLSLHGIIRPVFVVLENLGVPFPELLQKSEEIILITDQRWLINGTVYFNSFTTVFFSPYIDGGYLGEFLFLAMLGFISMRIYINFRIDNKYTSTAFVSIMMVILLSFFRFLFSDYRFALSFVYMYFCFGKKRFRFITRK